MSAIYGFAAWFWSLPWIALIPLGAALAIGGMLLLKAFLIVAGATMRGISILIQAGSQALAGLLLQLAGLVLMGIYVGCSKAWAPVQGLIERIAENREAAPVHDAYAKALEVLALKDDCTKDELDNRFKKAMGRSHQDFTDTPWLAQQINAARETIYANRGWQK